MEKVTYKGPILIFNNFDEGSKLLYSSLLKAGFSGKAVIINDDGFLDDNLISIYKAFYDKKNNDIKGKPCYFNRVVKPDYWEISSTINDGKITSLEQIKARIFYAEPSEKRYVKAVDWLGLNGQVRFTDHYNKKGKLFARTVFNKNGQMFCKTYYSSTGKELITENLATKAISVFMDGKEYIYQNRVDFAIAGLKRLGIEPTRILYNSLDTPFFISEKIEPLDAKHILFWQEKLINDKLPGNMLSILNNPNSYTGSIYFQRKDAYEDLEKINANKEIIKPLGFVYQFVNENTYNKQALICTNSDELENIVHLVESLPFMHFHIAAITEMSSKLMNMGKYSNVSLYPEAKSNIFEKLFNECDWYFDINNHNEIVSAVKQAFLHNQLIVAFKKTLHNNLYVASEHIFTSYKEMIMMVTEISSSDERIKNEIELQRKYALNEEISTYEHIVSED